jgi:hypothetical protein
MALRWQPTAGFRLSAMKMLLSKAKVDDAAGPRPDGTKRPAVRQVCQVSLTCVAGAPCIAGGASAAQPCASTRVLVRRRGGGGRASSMICPAQAGRATRPCDADNVGAERAFAANHAGCASGQPRWSKIGTWCLAGEARGDGSMLLPSICHVEFTCLPCPCVRSHVRCPNCMSR